MLQKEPALVLTTALLALFNTVLAVLRTNIPALQPWLTEGVIGALNTAAGALIAWLGVRPRVTPVAKLEPPGAGGEPVHIRIPQKGSRPPSSGTAAMVGLWLVSLWRRRSGWRFAWMPVLATTLLLVTGCAGSLEAARSSGVSARSSGAAAAASPERCDKLDDRHRLWGGLAKGFALAAGGTGLSTIPVGDRDARIALAAGAVVAGIGAATFTYLSESAAESYARDCSAR